MTFGWIYLAISSELNIHISISFVLARERVPEVFSPTVEGTRKVVIATNIAETSLTIDGIVPAGPMHFAAQHNLSGHCPCSKSTAKIPL